MCQFRQLSLSAYLSGDVFVEIVQGLDVGHLLGLDLEAEVLLHNHNNVDEVERVDAKVLLEACLGLDCVFVYLQVVD